MSDLDPAKSSGFFVFLSCLRREWRHQRYKFLVLTLAAVIFAAVLAYAGGSSLQVENSQDLPDFLKYKISLVSSEKDSIVIRVLQSQLAEMPFLSEVYVEEEKEAASRLENGETLLCIRFPDGFISAFQEGRETDPLHFSFNPAMPVEAVRLQAILKNWLRALNLVRQDIFIWQSLYEGYTGDNSGSYLQMTYHAMQSVGTFGQRYRYVQLEERNHFVGQGYFLAGTLLLFSLIPSLIFFDSRGRELDSVFQDRLIQLGASGSQYLSKLFMSFFLWAGMALPILYLSRLFVPKVNMGILTLYSAMIWLISFVLASAAAYISFTPSMRTAFSWLALLLALFFAGSIYPLELFPSAIRKIASFTPFHGLFVAILKELSDMGTAWFSRENLYLLWPLIPAIILLLLAKNKWRWSR